MTKTLIHNRLTANAVASVITDHVINSIFEVDLLQAVAAIVPEITKAHCVILFVYVSNDTAVQSAVLFDVLYNCANRQLITVPNSSVQARFAGDAVADVFAIPLLTGTEHDNDTLRYAWTNE